MFHNVWVAGHERGTSAHGVPLEITEPELINEGTVGTMAGLQIAERKEPGLGLALLNEFFPGRLEAKEEKFWKEASEKFTMLRGGKEDERQRERQQLEMQYKKSSTF